MASQKICRVCLIQDVKMYNFNEYNLKNIYEGIMSEEVKDDFPQFFCYECAAMLYKFHKFKQKCVIGLNTFKGILVYRAITPDLISKVDRKGKKLQSSIDILTVNKRVKSFIILNKTPDGTERNSEDIEVKLEISDGDDTNQSSKLFSQLYWGRLEDNNSDDEIGSIINDEKIFNKKKSKKVETVMLNKEINNIEDTNEIADVEMITVSEVDIVEEQYFKKEDPIQSDCDKELSDSDSDVIKEIMALSDSESEDLESYPNTSPKKKTKVGKANTRNAKKPKVTKGKKVKTKKAQTDKTSTNTIKKKATGGVKPRKIDPALWNITIFNEDEALADFEAKAFDPKYLAFPYKCELCFKGFSTEPKRTRHMKIVHCESRGSIVCKFCKQRFRLERERRKHSRVHYEVYKCQRCNYVCRYSGILYLHEYIHSQILKKCKHCDLKFRHMSTYYTHLRIYHRSEHVCSLCGESFVSEKGLKQHKQWSHMLEDNNPAEDDKPTYCEKCDIKFETQWAYNEHINRSVKHEGEFSTREVQREETNTEHNGEKKRKRHQITIIKCPTCPCSFRRSLDFVRHHNQEHKDLPLPAVVREVRKPNGNVHYWPRVKDPAPQNFMCEICGATLKGTSMASHMNARHTKEIIYSCSICKRGFTSETSRNRHILVHTREKPYKCTMCDTRFTQLGSMNMHYRRIHLKEPYPKRNRRKEKEARWEKESELTT